MRALSPMLALVLAGGACQRESLEESMPPPAPAPEALAQPPAAEEPPADDPTQPKTLPATPPEGFSKVVVDDQGPLCVFSDFAEQQRALFPKDAKPQKLKADATVVFGAYPPWCMHESCDRIPSLQCKVAQEAGNVLVVRTHYWGEHKAGSTCTEDCKPITAGCETAALPAGKYTVRHGEQSYPLRIPSGVRKPCFEPETAPEPKTPTTR